MDEEVEVPIVATTEWELAQATPTVIDADEYEEAVGSEIAIPERVVVPFLAEVVQTSDLPAVARAIGDVLQAERVLKQARDVLQDVFVAQSKIQGTKTLHPEGFVVEVSADTEVEWDVPVLAELLSEGLPMNRYDQLVTEIVSYKVDGRVARQLEGASDVYREIIERARVRKPKRQYARVVPVG